MILTHYEMMFFEIIEGLQLTCGYLTLLHFIAYYIVPEY
jgi:hypothetical protein